MKLIAFKKDEKFASEIFFFILIYRHKYILKAHYCRQHRKEKIILL